jgi:restriction endonuclease S subunit
MAQIKQIAKIRTGTYLKPDEIKGIVYLQVKDFNDRGEYIGNAAGNNSEDYISELHLLKDGDILFAAKGTKNFAAVYRRSDPRAVASTVFFVLSLKKDVLPEYVAWFINHPKTQRLLKTEAMGTSIPSISIGAISELEISIPDIQTQQIVVRLENLRSQERKLNQELNFYKEQLLDYKIFTRIMDKETN